MSSKKIRLILVLLSQILIIESVLANDELKKLGKSLDKIFGNFREDIGPELQKILPDELLNKDLMLKEKRFDGYCQIWSFDQLIYRSECQNYEACNLNNVCQNRYVWINRPEMILTKVYGQQLLLDGHPSQLVFYGEDPCYSTHEEGQDFCFTAKRQSPNLRMQQ
ncbi:MAG: hypothetical protein AAF478_05480 [Pseudomonadota bacterium]